MLVYVQPPNEVLLRARVLGAQDQYEYLSILFIARALQAKKRFFGGATLTFFSDRALREHGGASGPPLPLPTDYFIILLCGLFQLREGHRVGLQLRQLVSLVERNHSFKTTSC
jgi:hypothetical protein